MEQDAVQIRNCIWHGRIKACMADTNCFCVSNDLVGAQLKLSCFLARQLQPGGDAWNVSLYCKGEATPKFMSALAKS